MSKKKEDKSSEDKTTTSTNFEKELVDVIASAKSMVDVDQHVIQTSPALDIGLNGRRSRGNICCFYWPPQIW